MELTRRRLGAIAVGGIAAIGVGGGVVYFERGYQPDEDALQRVYSDEGIDVSKSDVGYVVRSGNDGPPATGFVLYPGGRVDPESYVPMAAGLVDGRELQVVIPSFPLNLAVLDSNRADDVIAAFPDVGRWYVGGHSLGGAMASRYANDNHEQLEGLVLLAAYADRDLSETGLRVLSVLGTADGVLDWEAERDARELLPRDARIVEIDGMVHSQFGAYGPQRGDGEPTISDRTAEQRVVSTVGDWLDGHTTID